MAVSLFELKVDELLKELVEKADENLRRATSLLKQLKDAIEGLPEKQEPLGVVNPFPPPKGIQYSLGYARPANINVIGSTASKTLLSKNGSVLADMVVVMPKSSFQDKDYRKYRYFHKKSYYTACLASGLQRHGPKDMLYEFCFQNASHLQPCILVKRKDDTSLAVRIICAAPADVFPHHKLSPWIDNILLSGQSSEMDSPQVTKTPFYNSTLRSEMLTLTYLTLIHKVGNESDAFRGASLLFSVWLQQRGLGASVYDGGFGTFEAQALMAIMLHGDPASGLQPMLHSRYSRLQLFKATLLLLSGRDFVNNPTVYELPKTEGTRAKQTQALQSVDSDVIDRSAAYLYDGVRNHNLLYKISPWAFARLQRQAKITVDCLNGNDENKFKDCFISRLDHDLIRYDSVLEVALQKLSSLGSDQVLKGLEANVASSNALYETLRKALGNRVLEISFGLDASVSWKIDTKVPRRRKAIQLNIVSDVGEAYKVQDLGPAADEKEAAAAFREFWGPKAELRKFRDGSIRETVEWDLNAASSIIVQIVQYAIQRHHGDDSKSSVTLQSVSFQDQVPQSITIKPFEDLWKGYRQLLEPTIRSLEMPLSIRSIKAASSGLGNTDKTPQNRMLVVVQFESSGSWPDDLAAIQQVKIAFLQKLGDQLRQANAAMSCRVGIGQRKTTNRMFPRPFLEVKHHQQQFEIVLYHDRELTLLKARLSESFEERKLVLPELAYHNAMYIQKPAHTQRVRELCTQYPLLAQSILLFKVWCSSHLLSNHFSEETLELFAIYSFTHPAPYGTPGSLRMALLRTVSMLAKWRWDNEPLFVPVTSETESDESDAIQQLNTHFEAWCRLDPHRSKQAMIVGSTIDPTGTVWTSDNRPSKVVAARLHQLAKVTYAAITEIDTGAELDVEQLFTPTLIDYDFVLHMNVQAGRDLLFSYLEELKDVFGEVVIWFYGDGSIVGGLWNPTIESAKWKVNLGYSSVPVDGSVEGAVRSNRDGMLNELVRLGGDLVKRVTLKDKK